MSRIAADIQKVLRKELDYLSETALDERVDDHREEAMRNCEELRQLEKDHGERMDELIKTSKEARTCLEQGTDLSPKTRATTISQGKLNIF